MAAAHSLSLLHLPAPSPMQRPTRYAACHRAGNGGGCGGAAKLPRVARLRRRGSTIVSAAAEAELPMEQAEAAMRVAADDDSITATVVTALLNVAFVGLSLLTLGVIYLAVQDFLQNREKEKFEREEAEKLKEEKKKKRAKARGRKRKY